MALQFQKKVLSDNNLQIKVYNMSSLLCLNLLAISKYRTELMGLAAIGIIACHANGNYVMMPIWLNKICGLGQLGVNVFFFLSGLGIWYSLQKVKYKYVEDSKWMVEVMGVGGVINWYLTRYKKTICPVFDVVNSLFCISDNSWWK